jgi:indole-3-glycerol phosphate synthase
LSGFLDRILESRRRAIVALDRERLAREAHSAPVPRDLVPALRGRGTSLIAEFKRASPSRGPLHPDADPAVFAKAFERGGAAAISVLAEPEFFGGSADDVRAAREATTLPVLWKDFVLDSAQVLLARASGADAVLLIVRILDDAGLDSIASATRDLGMTPVFEAFDERDLERALGLDPPMLGVNARDLDTFTEDPSVPGRLRALIGPGVLAAAFSGISSREDVRELEALHYAAILVGEALMRASDPEAKVRELTG